MCEHKDEFLVLPPEQSGPFYHWNNSISCNAADWAQAEFKDHALIELITKSGISPHRKNNIPNKTVLRSRHQKIIADLQKENDIHQLDYIAKNTLPAQLKDSSFCRKAIHTLLQRANIEADQLLYLIKNHELIDIISNMITHVGISTRTIIELYADNGGSPRKQRQLKGQSQDKQLKLLLSWAGSNANGASKKTLQAFLA